MRLIRPEISSISVARAPDKGDEDCDNGRARKHPVLDVDAENAEFLNEDVHRAPLCWANYAVRKQKYIIFIRWEFCARGAAQRANRTSSWYLGDRGSERGSRRALDDQSVEEILKCESASLVCGPVRAKSGATEADAHGLALAPNFPGPFLARIARPGYDDVKGPSWRRAQHQLTRAVPGSTSRRF